MDVKVLYYLRSRIKDRSVWCISDRIKWRYWVHDENEMDRVLAIDGIELIGINNRNLDSFTEHHEAPLRPTPLLEYPTRELLH
ncbi:indole-3-glycerol phosphate synthase, chloroplastic-like protein [Tanacetum coccineum]